jgi:hypothetical protein
MPPGVYSTLHLLEIIRLSLQVPSILSILLGLHPLSVHLSCGVVGNLGPSGVAGSC